MYSKKYNAKITAFPLTDLTGLLEMEAGDK